MFACSDEVEVQPILLARWGEQDFSTLTTATLPLTSSTHDLMDRSPFGRLPAELRNRIYEYLLEDGNQYCITTHFNERGVAKLKASLADQPLALARTCRTAHEEFTPLFYSSNAFMIRGRVGVAVLKSFDAFTSMIGDEKAKSLRSVVFRILEQRMDSFESVCSTHNDIKSVLERTATLQHGQYERCQFRVQVDLVHCSRAPANATFLLDLDFDRLEHSWDINMDSLQRKRKRFNLNGDFRPIIFILEECRQHLRKFMGNATTPDNETHEGG